MDSPIAIDGGYIVPGVDSPIGNVDGGDDLGTPDDGSVKTPCPPPNGNVNGGDDLYS